MGNVVNKYVNQTNKSLYIVDLMSPDQSLEIQFVPKELKTTATANHARIDVIGRNNPLYHYVNGEDGLHFQLDFYADDDNKSDVMERVDWLKALRYNDGYARRKSNVLLVWGDLFRDQNQVWIVTSVNATYSDFRSDYNFRPQQAFVDITLSLDPKQNIRKSDFRK